MRIDSIEYPELSNTEKGQSLFEGKFELIKNAEVEVEVLIGNKKITLEELYALKSGSVVTLNQSLSDPVTLLLKGSPIAYGELVASGDNFGFRITEISK